MAASACLWDPVSLNALKDWILERAVGVWLSEIKSNLESIPNSRDLHAEIFQSEKWHQWAITQTALRAICVDVPENVLPGGSSGQIIDVKVFCKCGPDDDVYDNNKEIRDRVARGNCFLKIDNGAEKGIRCILQAMRKFTGGLGDDDDREKGDNYTWKKYFTKPFDSAHIVIATKKANGEAAHLSCQLLNGDFVLCGGSKNVHIVFREKEHISLYTADRFRMAREICEAIMAILKEMSEDNKQRLLEFLCVTHYTAVFELLSPDHQHVVDLTHLERSELKFIAWTKSDLDPSDDDLLCTVPPNVGIELARAFGLQTVDYDIVMISDLEEKMKQIRQGYQYEGEVLYFLDETNTVIGLLKKKTVWYIICRAIREKLRTASFRFKKNPGRFSISELLNRIEGRIDEIQVWLGFNMEVVLAWKRLAGKFIRWCIRKLEEDVHTTEDFVNRFPVIWRTYLEESGEVDRFETLCSIPS
ncbi:hypothetical protein ScPMuIL_001760 [Solemya velum]